MNKTINPSEQIIFVSLANTMLFKTYEVWDTDSLNEAYDSFNEVLDKYGYHDTDIELQVAESITGLNDRTVDYLADMYQLQDDLHPNYNAELSHIIAMFNYYNNLEDVRRVIENGSYYVYTGQGCNTKLDAFQDYIIDCGGIYDRIPEDLHSYIDIESIYIDYKCGGMVTLELDDSKYMFIFND